MISLKRAGLLSGIVLLALLDISIYWNFHLYSRARKEEALEKKAALLEKSIPYFPWNGLNLYELGKTRFELALSRLDDAVKSGSDLRESVRHLRRSTALNPASAFSHFYLAQSLLHLGLVSPADAGPFDEELRKAALLAGENSQIFKQAGRIFMSRWPNLSDADKEYALELLRKTLTKKDPADISEVLIAWELNIKDYRVIEALLPEDARVYRQVAAFLGERSLSLEERHRYLARAEGLELAEAETLIEAGETDLSRGLTRSAIIRSSRALDLLRGIRLYRSLLGEDAGGAADLVGLQKSAFLCLVRSRLQNGDHLDAFRDVLKRYLSLEDRPEKVAALESELRGRGVIPGPIDANHRDLDRLVLEITLLYKQRKYSDIASLSAGLESRFFVIPDGKRQEFRGVLQMVEDSLEKTGRRAESEDFLTKAHLADPEDLETMLRLRRQWEGRADEARLREISRKIDASLSPRTMDLKGVRLTRGQAFQAPLTLEGGAITLSIGFASSEVAPHPLLSVDFNDRVVWDGYAQDEIGPLVVETNAGANRLQITAINCPVSLVTLTCRPVDGNKERGHSSLDSKRLVAL
jgi:tetratricopeptide (TPR) repeat protein